MPHIFRPQVPASTPLTRTQTPTVDTALPAVFESATHFKYSLGEAHEPRALLELIGRYASFGIDWRLAVFSSYNIDAMRSASGFPGNWGFQIANSHFSSLGLESQFLLLRAVEFSASKDSVRRIPLSECQQFVIGVALHHDTGIAIRAAQLLQKLPWLLDHRPENLAIDQSRKAARIFSDDTSSFDSRHQTLQNLMNSSESGLYAIVTAWRHLERAVKISVLEHYAGCPNSFAVSALFATACNDHVGVACKALRLLYQAPHHLNMVVVSSLVTLATQEKGLPGTMALGIIVDQMEYSTTRTAALFTIACDTSTSEIERDRIRLALGGSLDAAEIAKMGLELPSFGDTNDLSFPQGPPDQQRDELRKVA